MEAIALLEEWVQSIGSQAGLTRQNATILSGAVGVPESRLEARAISMTSSCHIEQGHQHATCTSPRCLTCCAMCIGALSIAVLMLATV